MANYFLTAEKYIADLNNVDEVNESYGQGFLFSRKAKNYMYQTRSLRVDISKFTPNSENRRILKKFSEAGTLQLTQFPLPVAEEDYSWQIHKLGKDFYASKFPGIKFSAQKIKEMITKEFSFNCLFTYHTYQDHFSTLNLAKTIQLNKGYCICYNNEEILHYCYPFYDLNAETNNLGMYMMIQAILWAQYVGKQYCYLGGATRAGDKYKLQFNGLEWWTGSVWSTDLEQLKQTLAEA